MAPAEPHQAGDADSRTVLDTAATVRSEGAARPSGAGSLPPPPVPDHELLRPIGRGSYGEVWLARNIMGTFRAVKVVYRAWFDREKPFEREFTGIQKFEPLSRSHSALVDVLQIGRTPECFYYVMELADDVVTGQEIDPARYQPRTLRQEVVERGQVPIERCVEIGLGLASGLQHLHSHGLIHRDIKPSNIIFVHGQPKLADIGLVAEQSEAKSFVGTEGFIPPEGPGTPAADVYSLGKVLYEMATGKDRHEFPELPSLTGTESQAGLVELNAIILKACQNEVKSRYATAEQLRQDLLLIQSGKSVKRAQVLERRLTALTRVSIVGGLLTAATVGMTYFFRRQASREASLRTRAQASEEITRLTLYATEISLAREKIAAGQINEARGLLEAQIPASGRNDLRGFEWHYLRGMCRDESLATISGTREIVQQVAVSPDGRWIAAPWNRTGLRIWTGFGIPAESRSIEVATSLRCVAFTSDSRRVAGSGPGPDIHYWDVTTGELLHTFPVPEGQTEFLAISPGSQWLAAGHRLKEQGLSVWNLGTFKLERTLETARSDRPSVAFSPDGRFLAVARGDHRIGLFRTPSFDPLPSLSGHDDQVVGVCFSPDGRMLASTSADSLVKLWDMTTQQEAGSLKGHTARVTSASFSSDGRWLATSCIDGTVKVWDLGARQELQTLTGHSGWINNVVFHPDGDRLISASDDHTVKIWNRAAPTNHTILTGHTRKINAIAFSPDGRLATGGDDGMIWLWDASKPPERLSLEPTQSVMSMTFSPDGERLAIGTWGQRTILWQSTAPRQHSAAVNGGEPLGFPGPDELLSHTGDSLIWWTISRDPLNLQSNRSLGGISRPYVDRECRLLADQTDTGMRLINPVTGAQLGFIPSPSRIPLGDLAPDPQAVLSWVPGGILFSPDRSLLASWSIHNPSIHLWSVNQGAYLGALSADSWSVACVTFSRDGRQIISGSGDDAIRVWDVAKRTTLAVLRGHSGWVTSVAVSPDGKTLASCGNDGTTRLWSLAAQREVTRLLDHTPAYGYATFAPNGDALAVFGLSSKAWLWRIPATGAAPVSPGP